jgi:class 3 adenylate cyclase
VYCLEEIGRSRNSGIPAVLFCTQDAGRSLQGAWHHSIGLHRGTLYTFRSFLYGRDVWIASQLQSASAKLLGSEENGIFVTAAVRSALFGTPPHNRLQPIALVPLPAALAGIEVYRLCNASFEQ